MKIQTSEKHHEAPELIGQVSTVDVLITNHGTIYTVLPKTPTARAWILFNVADDAQWFGSQLVVEHRYIRDLVQGMMEAGLKVV